MKSTIRQIAELAEVSPATVSRVLNNTLPVSPVLKDRVLCAAQQLEYTSNKNKNTKNHLILLLIPRFSNPFYTEIIQGILDTSSLSDFDVIIRQANSASLNNFNTTPILSNEKNKIAGILSLCRLEKNGWLLNSLPEGLPVVQCCEYNEDLSFPVVSIDHYKAAYQATSHLINSGHTKLALFNSSLDTLYGRVRENGFIAALTDFGIPVRPDWILHLGDVDYRLALATAKTLFSQNDYPDAIFAVSDVYAIGAIKSIHSLGLKVPDDVSVIGFDDTEIAALSEPALTTVRQPRYQLGSTACNILLQYIQNKSALSQYYWMESDLIIRESTKSKILI